MSYCPKRLLLFLLALAGIASSTSHALTETVPKNVKAFVYSFMHGNIPGSFGETGVERSLNVNATLGSSILKNLSPEVSAAYQELSNIDPTLASSLDLGKIDLDPRISANIHAVGLAYGIRDDLMIAAGVPMYDARVVVNGGYLQTSSLNSTVGSLKGYSQDASLSQKTRDSALILSQILAQLPTMRGEYLQGALVNDYGYKPVGNWNGSGTGDLDAYSQYRFLETDFYLQAFKLGQLFPTGRVDDPDNLVDVPFGTGYYSTYAESLHGLIIVTDWDLKLGFSARYQKNWDGQRSYRLSPSEDFPLSRTKENVKLKPGDEQSYLGQIGSKILGFDWNFSYQIKNKARDRASGKSSDYDYGILTRNSRTMSHTMSGELGYSTVALFKKNKFPIPLMASAGMSRVYKGINTEKLKIYAFTLKVFF